MRPETLSIFAFTISLVSYAWIGFLWILYDTYFSLAGLGSTQSALVQASKIQTISFLAFFGAFGTAIAVYAIEKHFSAPTVRHPATQ